MQSAAELLRLFQKIQEFPQEYETLKGILSDYESMQGKCERVTGHEDFYRRELARLKKTEEAFNELKKISSSAEIGLANALVDNANLKSELSWIENPERMGR